MLLLKVWTDWHTTWTGTWDISPFLHTYYRSLQALSTRLAHAKFTDSPSHRKLGLSGKCISKKKNHNKTSFSKAPWTFPCGPILAARCCGCCSTEALKAAPSFPPAMPGSNKASIGFLWGWICFLISFYLLFPWCLLHQKFFLLWHFSSAEKLHIIPGSDQYSWTPALPQHCSHRGWRHTVRHPPRALMVWVQFSPCSFANPDD